MHVISIYFSSALIIVISFFVVSFFAILSPKTELHITVPFIVSSTVSYLVFVGDRPCIYPSQKPKLDSI